MVQAMIEKDVRLILFAAPPQTRPKLKKKKEDSFRDYRVS